jgi:dynein heavy chain, axonemal
MRLFTCLLIHSLSLSLSCSLKGLPKDSMSTENGAIVHASLRWPLFIDPQLQGLSWIRNMESSSSSSSSSSSITVISSATPHWIKLLNKCVTNGTTCVIEGLNGSIDPILLPLVSKNVIRKGRSLFVTIGSEEVLYDSQFKLFLHTQSSNPHFSPEVAAQCAIIDFTVTQVYLYEPNFIFLFVLSKSSMSCCCCN